MSVHELTENDNSIIIKAAKDDKVKITLAWKPSSGFCWQEAEGDAGVLERIDHPGEDPKPGAAVLVIFVFRIVRSGLITLHYARPWDENNKPQRWFLVNVEMS